MKTVWLLLLALGCQQASASNPVAREAPAPFIVHEWGTFATMQGSRGGALDGLEHETESLPGFVHARTESTPSPFRLYGDHSSDVPVRRVNSKMETPVLYFYSDVKRRVKVRVGFTGGLMTHWFPRFSLASPEVSARGEADVSTLRSTFLEWDVELIPTSERAPQLPEVEAGHPWQLAREVRAAWLRTVGADAESERYLFYRGLGRLDLPIRVRAERSGFALVANESDHDVAAAFVLEMGPGGRGRFVALGALKEHEVRPVQLTGKLDDVVPRLEREVHAALVAQGLFADEATAMVKTWSDTWFAAEGTRVVYVIPRAITDQVLPITIDPRPDLLVRVMVGRHEYLSPEAEADLERAVLANDLPRLARLGRFLEPALRRIASNSPNRLAQARAKALLASFH